MSSFNHAGPHFAVRDVTGGVAFYANVLEFDVDYLDGDPPRYAVVFRDDVYVHLSMPDSPDFIPGAGRAFISVSYVESVSRRAVSVSPGSVVQALEDRDFGQGVRFRVFSIADPDGNTLRIGEPLNVTP